MQDFVQLWVYLSTTPLFGLTATIVIGGLSMQARGFALGTASHGIGAARAMQVDPDAGAYAGLALGVQVLLAALLMPLVARWF